MKEIGKVIAGVCAFFFVVSGVSALLFFNIEQKAFSSETYKQAFEKQGLYAQMPVLIAGVMTEPGNNIGGTSTLLSLLDTNELALVISSLLPPADIEAVTDDMLDSTFAFLNNESDSVRISLIPIKQNLAGEGGIRALTQVLQAQPDCTPEQVLQMGLGLLSANTDLMMCNPPQEVLQLVRPLIEAQIQAVSLGIPDELTLITADQTGTASFRTKINRTRTVMKWTFILPFFLLLTLTLFAVRSLNDWLTWWGIPFLVTGLAAMLIALVGAPLIRFFVEVVILQGNAGIHPVLLGALQNSAGSIAGQILTPVAIQGMVLTLIGGGMAVVYFVIKRLK